MYCSSCGASVPSNLSYCNRCGVNLKSSESLSTAQSGKPAKLTGLVALGISTMFVLPLSGVAMIYAMIGDLKTKAGFPLEYVMTLAVIGLLIEALGVVLLSRVVSPLIKVYLQSGEPVELRKPELSGRSVGQSGEPLESRKPELSERPVGQIEPAREPASSVTDNTTRTFALSPALSQRERGSAVDTQPRLSPRGRERGD